MSKKIEIIGVEDIPLINPGDNIPLIIFKVLTKNSISLEDGDILIIAQTIISKSLGRLRNLEDINRSEPLDNKFFESLKIWVNELKEIEFHVSEKGKIEIIINLINKLLL